MLSKVKLLIIRRTHTPNFAASGKKKAILVAIFQSEFWQNGKPTLAKQNKHSMGWPNTSLYIGVLITNHT